MLDIDTAALAALRQLQRQLPEPVAGLRLIPGGDACQGWRLSMVWVRAAGMDEICWLQDGVMWIADRRDWPLLRGGQIRLVEREGVRGLAVTLQPDSCQCASGHCAPQSAGPSTADACTEMDCVSAHTTTGERE